MFCEEDVVKLYTEAQAGVVQKWVKCGEELEKSATTSQGHHTVDHSQKDGRRKRQWSIIYIQSTADGITVNRTSELLPVQH